MSTERQQALGIFAVNKPAPDYCKLAADIVRQVWRDTRGSPSRAPRIPPESTLSFWSILAGYIEQAALAIRRRPAPAPIPSNIDGPCQGIIRMINREIRAARGLPDEGSEGLFTGPEQHILEQLEPDERTFWDRLPAVDRAKLAREFTGGPITDAGKSYLKKKVQLLAPGPDVQIDAQPAAVGDSLGGKG